MVRVKGEKRERWRKGGGKGKMRCNRERGWRYAETKLEREKRGAETG